MKRHSSNEEEAVKRLLPYAKRKKFVASVLLHSYNGDQFSARVRETMRYAASEPSGSTYEADVMVVFELMKRGVELQEVIGEKGVEDLYNHWGGWDGFAE